MHTCTRSVHTHPLARMRPAVQYMHLRVQTQPVSCMKVTAHTCTTYTYTSFALGAISTKTYTHVLKHTTLTSVRTHTCTHPCTHPHVRTHPHTCVFSPGRCMYVHTQPIFSAEAHKHTHTVLPHPSPPSSMHLQAGTPRMPLLGHARYGHVPGFLPVGDSGSSYPSSTGTVLLTPWSCGPKTCSGRGDCAPKRARCMP